LAVLNSVDGTDYEISKAAGKEVLFCGLPGEDIVAIQDALLESGIYPSGSNSVRCRCLAASSIISPLAKPRCPRCLELGGDTTHSYIVSTGGVEASRPIPQGIEAMIPVVQKNWV